MYFSKKKNKKGQIKRLLTPLAFSPLILRGNHQISTTRWAPRYYYLKIAHTPTNN